MALLETTVVFVVVDIIVVDIVVVKLHSDLRILTQLQLVGVGVDFVFPLEEEEGRRRKEGITPT